MVHLTTIYTRTGDMGETSLGDGRRVSKFSLRVEAYGTVDEANASLGAALALAPPAAGLAADHPIRSMAVLLESIQHDLFDVGADLCTPVTAGEQAGSRLRVIAEQTARLEREIDRYNACLPSLQSFVLPGGTPLAALLHVARTTVRRAERLVACLISEEGEAVNAEALRYLNRLSDLLFVLGRSANATGGSGDVLWQPGKHRGS